MRTFGALFLVIVIAYYAAGMWPRFQRLERLSSEELAVEHYVLEQALSDHERNGTLPAGGYDRLKEMRSEDFGLRLEKLRRDWKFNEWMPPLGILGAVFMVLPFFRRSRNKKSKKKKHRLPDGIDADSVQEAPPAEEYVDEYDFHRMAEGGFVSREEALAWLFSETVTVCDYCGGRMRSTLQGTRETVKFVTFYKKVPPGAQDLRIVLGSAWFAYPASELKCANCQRVVKP